MTQRVWKPDVCIYHHPCHDGFASAWVVRKKYPDVVLAGTNYGMDFPYVDISKKNLLIADFSYKPDILRELGKKAKSVVVLDHHKTAEKDLEQYLVPDLDTIHRLEAGVVAYFDMNRSGARLTWDFMFPHSTIPDAIRLIEDRDLWRNSLPFSRPFHFLLQSFPYDLNVWSNLFYKMDHDTQPIIAQADAIERFFDARVEELLLTASLKKIGKWQGVAVAHAPYAFTSDLGNALLKAYPDAPFSAVIVHHKDGITYSLRSEDSRQDVGEVARLFGGGGHRNASGFRIPA